MCIFAGMKQNLSEFIKENANLRQLLLKQDGGIMKFWAEHPDMDFDVYLFDDYENQIVKEYLQANKQNRAIRSLPTDKLKNKSLDWYHQSKGSEFKFIVAIKSELNAIDVELYEQILKEVDIYMVDAYNESRRRKYPDGIPPQDFYNEVIEKYSHFGLAIDCLGRVLQEYRGRTVDLTDKRGILTILRQLDGLAPTSPELEEVNKLQTEFDIRNFIGNFFTNGGYKKLRHAIKEIIDKGTQNLTKEKFREKCCKIAEDNMMKVNQFTRWVNNESYPLKEIEEGKFIPLITPEERLWLQNIMYDNSPGATGTKKFTDMDRHFCHFLSILQGIGKLWAAQLLVRGIDMKELEKEAGIIMNRLPGMLYYVDRFMDDQRGECNIYDLSEAKNLLAKVKPIKEDKAEEAIQAVVTDFEHLKDWKNNPDLDYYLSEKHWNYHVNSLLYKNLLVFHVKELGAFLDLSSDNFTQPIKDYTSLYGSLINEAYRLCYNVLTTPVPETKVAHFANQAATWKFRDLKDENGNPIELVPNVTDLIESYHILGMANAILTFSDVQKKAVNEFLIALSVYNDNGMSFCGINYNFEAINETYEALILANMVNGTMLRPGYDNISRDKYLRHNIPWYNNLASILEKEKQKEKEKKATSILEQHNNNCQQFFGPTFIMPAATPSSKNASSKKGGGNLAPNAATMREKQHGMEYPVFSKGSGVTDDHIKALYRLLTARGWISTQTKEVDFLRLFSGKSNDCEIIWTGQDKLGDNKPTRLGVSALYVLFIYMFDEKLITTGSEAQKVGPILEMHFVDTDGLFLKKVSNVNKTSAKANDYIKQILSIMRMRPSSESIQRLLEEEMESKFDKNDRQDMNYRKPR